YRRCGRGRHRWRRDRAGAQHGADGGGRGRGNVTTTRLPAAAEMRPGAGLLLQPADACGGAGTPSYSWRTRKMMLHIPGVLTPEQVAHMRQRLADADWIDGRATVGDQCVKVKHNRQLAENTPLAQELGQLVLDALARNALFFSAALPLRTCPPMFNS